MPHESQPEVCGFTVVVVVVNFSQKKTTYVVITFQTAKRVSMKFQIHCIQCFFFGERYILGALLAFKTYTFWTTFGAFWTSSGCTLRKRLILERLDLRWMHVIESFDLRWMHGQLEIKNSLFSSPFSAAQRNILRISPSYSYFPKDISSNSAL